MSATRLQGQIGSLSRFDVVGEDGASPMFVRHVGLASRETREVRPGDEVPVDHMGPPLKRDHAIVANVVGTANLTNGQVKQIEVFLNAHANEHKAQEALEWKRFVIRPHVKPFEENGKTVCMRFSCVGLVIEAYREAGIDLIDTDEERLPSVSRETLGKVYEVVLRESWADLNDKFEWGLDENEEECWPVVLPGYVFHALNRDATKIREEAYKARSGDGVFPR